MPAVWINLNGWVSSHFFCLYWEILLIVIFKAWSPATTGRFFGVYFADLMFNIKNETVYAV